MNKGRLFFDPLRFKKLKAQEDRRKRAKIYIIASSVLASIIFLSLSIFGFSMLNDNSFGTILDSEANLVSSMVTSVSEEIFAKNDISDGVIASSNCILNEGNCIVDERIEAQKKALEEQRLLEEKKKKEEEERKRKELLAQAQKSNPKPVAKKPQTTTIPQTLAKGGDVKEVDIDLNNEYLPVNPEDLDPTGNYGIPEYWPIQGINVSSKYGYLPSRGRFHAGVDLVADSGTPICAAGAGKVIRASWFAGYGNCIDIQHSSGYITRYGHLSSYIVKVGDFVDAGVWIGLCGSTGRSSCPHLHFEVHKNGKSMNPESSSLSWAGKP